VVSWIQVPGDNFGFPLLVLDVLCWSVRHVELLTRGELEEKKIL
jgi:hypothetical protein